MQISAISFGTLYGTVNLDGTDVAVPVDDESLAQIAELSGGQAFQARGLDPLEQAYGALQQQIGYETVNGDASTARIALGAALLAASIAAAALINRRLPS